MTAHSCKVLTHGCYRCELNVDELRSAVQDMRTERDGLIAVEDLIQDRKSELNADIRELERAIDKWEMSL